MQICMGSGIAIETGKPFAKLMSISSMCGDERELLPTVGQRIWDWPMESKGKTEMERAEKGES